MKTITLEDGKYEFYEDTPGIIKCKRYGEEWRDFTGDKAIYNLFMYALERTYCDCGKELSPGRCTGNCDRDD